MIINDKNASISLMLILVLFWGKIMKHATNSPLEEKGSSKLFEYGFIILLLIVIMILYFNQQVLINDKSRIIMLVYTIIYILIGITAFILIKNH